MKIAILIFRFPPKWLAGAEIATYNLAKYLAKKGHEIHVVTSLDKNQLIDETRDGFFIHRIKFINVPFIGLLNYLFRAFLSIKNINPDVVHTQTLQVGTVGVLAKYLLNKKYVVWGRGSDVYLMSKRKFISSIFKVVLSNASHVIALTNDMKKEMNILCDRDISVIPNGIDIDKFSTCCERGQINNKKTILYVGRLTSIKGVKHLIEAFSIVKNVFVDVQLLIIGEGADKNNLMSLVTYYSLQNDVRFIGKVPNDDIPKYMLESDLFVLPSYSEGFPNTVLEAMAAGLPIIATNVGGLPDIIENGIEGYLVEPKSSTQIAEKIVFLFDNGDSMDKISKINKKKASEYSWDMVVNKLEYVYENL